MSRETMFWILTNQHETKHSYLSTEQALFSMLLARTPKLKVIIGRIVFVVHTYGKFVSTNLYCAVILFLTLLASQRRKVNVYDDRVREVGPIGYQDKPPTCIQWDCDDRPNSH